MISPYNGILFSIKRNEVLLHVTTWMKLKNMLSERNQMQKTMYCKTSAIGKSTETGSRLVVARG